MEVGTKNSNLKDIAEYYLENLVKRKFTITIGKKDHQLQTFELNFSINDFKHIFGIHKLVDIRQSKMSSNALVQEIINGKTTLDDLRKSKHFNKITNRLENYFLITEILTNGKVAIKPREGKFFGIKADILLYVRKDVVYSLLFVKQLVHSFGPVTFFCDSSNDYMRNNYIWTIISCKIDNKVKFDWIEQ